MDKNSLSEYGWIIIIVIILSILIAFAPPFGKFVVTSIQNTVDSFVQSASGTVNMRPLDAPQNLCVKVGATSDILTFDEVPKADGYKISIGNDEPFVSDTTTVDITGKLEGIEGSVNITVSAFNEEKDGNPSVYTHLIPGLYRTGSNYTELVTPWRTLVSNNVIHVDDGMVYTNFAMDTSSTFGLVNPGIPTNSSAEHLNGDLALPHDGSITAIGDASVNMGNAIIEGDVAFALCEYLTGIKIPTSVTSISDGAFLYCISLIEIQIPDSVTSVGRAAFADCFNLQDVMLSNNITVIREDTFAECECMTTIRLPSKLNAIEDYAFVSCFSLENISLPQSVETIGDNAFGDCCSITNLSISKNVQHIGTQAFAGCISLTELAVSPENARYKMINNCLVDTTTKTLLLALDGCTIPTSDILHVDTHAVSAVTSLEDAVLPDGLLSIGNGAFANCPNLKSVVIPSSVTEISGVAFYNCQRLESIIIPEKVTAIGEHTFRYDKNLKTVTLSSGVTEIGMYAFAECSSLTDIYFNGSQEQWNNIAKNYNWDKDTGAYTVHCTDGDIAKG